MTISRYAGYEIFTVVDQGRLIMLMLYIGSQHLPSVFNCSGNLVKSVSLNICDDYTNTYYAYAQKTNNSTWQNFARNGSSTITLNTTGRHIQLSNGSSSANMYASAYYPVSLPYYFQTSNSLEWIGEIIR